MPNAGSLAIADDVPWADELTDYDRAHFTIYVRLLDASAAHASDDDMCRLILSVDPQKEPERARRTLASHLRRARWMSARGYRQLLRR